MKAEKIIIAETILEQLGGNKFRVMTGAKDFVATGKGIRFRIPGKGFAKNGINIISIELNSMDTYDMSFSRFRGSNIKLIESLNDVYAEDLQSVFKECTGLSTSL